MSRHEHRRKWRRRRRRGPRRLFWRVYAFGLALLAMVAISVGVANILLSPSSSKPWGDHRQFVTYVDGELTPLLDRPDELQAKVDRIHNGFNVDVAIYAADNSLMAHAGETPAPLDAPPAKPKWLRRGGAMPVDGGRAYAVARWQGGGWSALFVPLVVLLVLALVSAPLVRSIVRPIEKITKAARKVGEGELDARTGVTRRDEVGVLAAAFDDMAARLERMVSGEKELRANVSHELRTPLARVRVALEIAEEGDDPATIQKHLRGIRGDIIELEELVDQVLITARLDLANDDELGLRRVDTDIADVAHACAERFREVHEEHPLEVSALPVSARVDAKLVKRVIDNLLENSAKYAAPEEGPISLDVEKHGGAVRVTVADRGIGVAEDELGRLFEPFFRADSVRSQNTKGVGLGLSFCRRVIEAHGGEISARRRDGGGLEVTFEIPG